MDGVTTVVGYQFHHFKSTICSTYETHKLPQDVEAHTQCDTKQVAKQQNKKQRVPLIEPE